MQRGMQEPSISLSLEVEKMAIRLLQLSCLSHNGFEKHDVQFVYFGI